MAAFVSAEHGGTTKNADPCAQEMLVVGNCRAAFVKWTYNAQTGLKFHSFNLLYGLESTINRLQRTFPN